MWFCTKKTKLKASAGKIGNSVIWDGKGALFIDYPIKVKYHAQLFDQLIRQIWHDRPFIRSQPFGTNKVDNRCRYGLKLQNYSRKSIYV